MFKCTTVYKFAQEDSFENGCTGEYHDAEIDCNIKGENLDSLKRQIAEFVECDVKEVEVNPCGDMPNRIDASRLENGEGYMPTDNELEQWKQGNYRLWYVTYSFYFDETKPAFFY